jgi:hypothetical protein
LIIKDIMSELLNTIDSLAEEEAGTLILVNAEDAPVGSASMSDLAASAYETRQFIHRTASLHVFLNEDPDGKEMNGRTAKMLLSAPNLLTTVR